MSGMEVFLAVAGIVISVLMYFAGVQRGKRERAEDAQGRARETREARIAGVTERYLANTLKVANMAGALRAGVTSLNDWSEVHDFCDRVNSAGETPVVPQPYRQSIRKEDLLTFFQLLSKAHGWEGNESITQQVIETLKTR
jgi:hypothetical protein